MRSAGAITGRIRWSAISSLRICAAKTAPGYLTIEDLTIPLNTEKVNGLENTEITWRVGTWDESLDDIGETLDPNGGYYTVNEDGTEITLHGAALSNVYNEEAGNTWFHISAEVKTDGNTLCSTGTGIEVRPECLSISRMPGSNPGDRNLLPVDSFYINPQLECYVENAEYPYGETVTQPGNGASDSRAVYLG